ncbi:hypothetical protein JL720_9352 [Aureococcus anophagefferens]|nr:hypothetical protein JL720_9352 [Aureococcus anophagefferens]
MLLLLRRAVARPPRFARAQSSVVASPHVEWRSAADLRAPEEWYPKARLSRRRVIYHGGPTNSGKTYHALEALKRADADGGGGVYAGPLRLLALEVYAAERRAATAASSRARSGARSTSAARWTRRPSWSGSAASRATPSSSGVRAAHAADASAHLGGWTGVKKGDCVVTFSRDDIHRVRREIETANEDMKCCVVYGQLPPKTRAQQARLFNDEASGYDVLVASDAVGMGLNLNIGRVLFRQILKYSGELSDEALDGVDEAYREDSRKTRLSPVEHQLVKQIAGRAGRMATAFSSGGGGVTAMDAGPRASSALAAPSADEVAKVVKKLDDDIRLDLADMLLFCTAPCNLNDRFAVSMLNAYAAPAAAAAGEPARRRRSSGASR